MYLFIYVLTYFCTLFMYLFIYVLIYLCTYLLIYLQFIYLQFIYLQFIYLLIDLLIIKVFRAPSFGRLLCYQTGHTPTRLCQIALTTSTTIVYRIGLFIIPLLSISLV